MKKLICLVGAIALLISVSCKKSTEGNTSILVTDTGLTKTGGDSVIVNNKMMQTYTDRYVAEDGSAALVTFKNSDGKKEISIASNKMTIKAPQTDVDGTYADHDYEIIAKDDSIKITQGNNVITLKKARGQ